MKDLNQELREVEERHADEQMQKHLESTTISDRDQALMDLGGFIAIDRLTNTLTAGMMRKLIQWQEDKKYLRLGYQTFAEFLTKSDVSPMTKSKFYDLKALLEKEGDPIFDLFTTWGLPQQKRKLLGKGTVELDGETLIIRNGDEITTVEVKDRDRLLETLTALADANAEKAAKLAKQAETIGTHAEKTRELYNEIDRVKASKAAEIGQDPHSMAMVNLTLAYRAVIESVEQMSAIEKEQFAPRDFELIAARNADLAEAYGRSDWTKIVRTKADASGEVEDLDALINRALDEDDDNDAELAKSL